MYKKVVHQLYKSEYVILFDNKINILKNIRCILVLAMILFSSCNETGHQEDPTSTPIDSTNIHGTAPVDYNDTSNNEMVPPEPTRGDRANTPDGDSIPSTRK
jgi:hypothetical protein